MPSLEDLKKLERRLDPARWRTSSDVAQVVASYLARHPSVAEVRYPGLREDALFARASCTLEGGFGPIVTYRTTQGEPHTLDFTDATDARAAVLRLEVELGGGC